MRLFRLLTMVLVFACVGSIASGQAFFDDFESFAPGEFLNDVDGWHGWDDTAGAGSPVSDAQAYSGSNSVEIIGAADLVHEYDIAGGKWVLSAMQYIPSGTTGTSWFILLNTYNDGGEKVWSSETQFNLASGAITVPQDGSASAEILYDQWVKLECVIDLDENTIEKYYDGVLFSTHVWDSTNHGTIGAIDLYGNNASSVFYDDIKIQSYLMSLSGAAEPVPGVGADDVPRDGLLAWTPGVFAAKHNVYFGTDMDAVASGTVPAAAGLVDASFDPGRLAFSQTYYWRVDEVNAAPDNTVFKGDVWSFTAEPYSVQISGDSIIATASTVANEFSPAARTIDGSGLDGDTHSTSPEDMWFTATPDIDPWIQYEFSAVKKLDTMKVWNSNGAAEMALGWGVKDVIIEYSVDGENWEVLPDANQFSRAPGLATYNTFDTIALGGVPAKMVRFDIQSNWGGLLPSFSIGEIQFFEIPAAARQPEPAVGAVDVHPTASATWRAGREAAEHTIYLSTDPNAVVDGTADSVSSSTNTLDLGVFDLDMGQTYSWRVDEVNDAEATPLWTGPVWSFTTADSVVVDDFESYGNLSPNRPFQAWLDGFGYSADDFFPVAYGGNGTGSGIGHDIWTLTSPHYDGDIMETAKTLPGSSKSMPLYYTNAGATASETQRKFTVPQDWTVGGAQTLSIPFAGTAGNTGTLYAKINGVKVTYTGDPANLAMGAWLAFNIDLTAVNTNLQSVTELVIGVEGNNASGMLLIDDITLHKEGGNVVTPVDPGTANLAGAWDFDEGTGTTASDASGNGHTGTLMGGLWDTGVEGSAYSVNDTDYVATGFAGVTGTAARTCTAWIKTTEANRAFLAWGKNTSGRKWRMRLDATGGLRIEVNGGYHYGQTFLADGEWHHTAVVLADDGTPDVSETLLYVDGMSEGTQAVLAKAIDTDPTGEVRIGRAEYDNAGFIGLIDDARVYDRALSPAEIMSVAGLQGPVDLPF